MEDSGGVDREAVRPVLVGELHRGGDTQDSRDVHQDADRAELAFHQLDGGFDRRRVGDVQQVGVDGSTGGRAARGGPDRTDRQLVGELGERTGVAVDRRDDGAGRYQRARHRRAYPLSGAGDHRDGAREFGLLH